MRLAPPGAGTYYSSLPHAAELFTDREPESIALKGALARFRKLLDGGREVGLDRHNVLMFYGMGGIGKTALSERLEMWVKDDLPLDAGWGPRPATKVDATTRIDLHGSTGQMDFLAALVTLRSNLGGLRRHWPVFDLTFTAYWSAVNPGQPPPVFGVRNDGGDAVAETVADLLADLGGLAGLPLGAPAGLGAKGVRKLVGQLRRRRDMRLAVDAYDGFERFLMRCADEPSPTDPRPLLACEIAAGLSWELARLVPSPLVMTFIDATERLAIDPRRVAEGQLNLLMHQMPNVFFVLTGREKLDWYDERRADLPFSGSRCWPGLVQGASLVPGQHQIENLSAADSKSMILRGREQLQLPMDDEVVDELVKASAGLPQYLELARQAAISVKDAGAGRRVLVGDVTGSLDSLVMKVLDNVPQEEQRVVRAGCLFRMFDVDLVAAAANTDHGCAARATSRSMIDYYSHEQFPYRIHDALRKAVREAGPQIAGGWSERDWQLASTRAAAAARRLHDEAKQQENHRGVLDAIGIAVQLVCDQQTVLEEPPTPPYRDWLTKAIIYAPSIQGLRSRIPSTSRTEYGQRVLDFVAAKSTETPIEERLRLLRGIFDSDHPLAVPAGRHLGYTLKSQQRWDEALTVFDELVSLSPTPVNVRQGPMVLSLSRRFADARDAAVNVDNPGYLSRVADYAHGRQGSYFPQIGAKIDMYRRAGRQRELLEELGDLAVRRAFFRGDISLQEVVDLQDKAEEAGHMVSLRCALQATVLLQRSSAADVAVALERLRTLDLAASANGEIGFRFAFAEFCDATLRQDAGRLQALWSATEGIRSRSRPWIPVECFLASAGLPLTPVPTQWLEPAELVLERWTAHLHTYLARTAAVDPGN